MRKLSIFILLKNFIEESLNFIKIFGIITLFNKKFVVDIFGTLKIYQ